MRFAARPAAGPVATRKLGAEHKRGIRTRGNALYSCASAHGRASSWLRLSPCPLPDEMHPRRRRGRTSERIATRHRRRGVIDPRSPALHADPATPAPGKSWLLRHGPVQREGPAQGQAADLVARGMAAAAARRRSVGTWSRDGIAPARVVAGRAPETPPKLKPALELLLGPGFGAGSGWRSCGARRGGSGCDPSARGPRRASPQPLRFLVFWALARVRFAE